MAHLLEFLRNIDEHVGPLIRQYGSLAYFALFITIFCETGLVVTPFLPGDTLLFTAGVFSRPEKEGLNVVLVLVLLTAAALSGDTVNYHIGRRIGPRLFRSERARIFRRSHLERTHEFFDRYGGRTLMIARWVPIVRTYAPFVTGASAMPFRTFIAYSAAGAGLWVGVCVMAGHLFGQLPVVRENFGWAMLSVVLVTLVPVMIEIFRHRRRPAPRPPERVDLIEPDTGP